MRVHIIGVGLIGGSFALDIRNTYSNVTLVGIDKNHENHQQYVSIPYNSSQSLPVEIIITRTLALPRIILFSSCKVIIHSTHFRANGIIAVTKPFDYFLMHQW